MPNKPCFRTPFWHQLLPRNTMLLYFFFFFFLYISLTSNVSLLSSSVLFVLFEEFLKSILSTVCFWLLTQQSEQNYFNITTGNYYVASMDLPEEGRAEGAVTLYISGILGDTHALCDCQFLLCFHCVSAHAQPRFCSNESGISIHHDTLQLS